MEERQVEEEVPDRVKMEEVFREVREGRTSHNRENVGDRETERSGPRG